MLSNDDGSNSKDIDLGLLWEQPKPISKVPVP